jgi:hypothetical protein
MPLAIPAPAAPPAVAGGEDAKILTRCSCGKSFQAPAKFAGKMVRCPGCKEPLRVPASKAPDQPLPDQMDLGGVGSLLDEVGFQRSSASHRCPECREDLEKEAILCIHCGYNLETGKKMTTKVVGRRTRGPAAAHGGFPDAIGPAEVAPELIQKAAGTLRLMGFLSAIGLAFMIFALIMLLQSQEPVDANALPILVVQLALVIGSTSIYFSAASLLVKGSKAGWIMSVVMSVLMLPSCFLPLGILNLIRLFDQKSKDYCR